MLLGLRALAWGRLLDNGGGYMSTLIRGAAWCALQKHHQLINKVHLRQLFVEDPLRGERLTLEAAGLYLDYSKNRITDETLSLLFNLARERDLEQHRDAMFSGYRINQTEDRAVLHVALRAPRNAVFKVDGHNVMPHVHQVLDRMAQFVQAIHGGHWRGYTGKSIRHVINIGIGGSYLGPQLAYEALKHLSDRVIDVRFVANVDGADLQDALHGINPAETLCIVASKTFTTLETMVNAKLARQWLVEALGSEDAVGRHFVAVSANVQAASAFGIAPDNVFGFWDWVGGRYSLESAIGLAVMLSVGVVPFYEMLAGSYEMDEHFQSAPLDRNMPVLLGLLAIWYNNFFGAQTAATLPYAHSLARLPAYLQQLQMESNGKHVDMSGQNVDYETGAIVWGEPGVDAQHSFYQLLHQGTRLIPCDLIGFLQPMSPYDYSHSLLIASLFAQAEALAFGKSHKELEEEGMAEAYAPFAVCEGNRPTNIILAEALTPRSLGSLIALYEHMVFVQGAIWGIDSFDQWGVELGKRMAQRIIAEFEQQDESTWHHDSSTATLMRRYRASRNRGR